MGPLHHCAMDALEPDSVETQHTSIQPPNVSSASRSRVKTRPVVSFVRLLEEDKRRADVSGPRAPPSFFYAERSLASDDVTTRIVGTILDKKRLGRSV